MLRGIPPRYRRAPNESRLLSGFPTGGIPSSLSSPVYQALSATNNGTIVIQDSTPDNIAYVGPMLLPLYGGIFGHPDGDTQRFTLASKVSPGQAISGETRGGSPSIRPGLPGREPDKTG